MLQRPSGKHYPEFQALVATVNDGLVKDLDPATMEISQDLLLASHERDFLKSEIWTKGLDQFLPTYIPWAEPSVLNLTHKREKLFDEHTVALPVTQFILRHSLKGEPVSLADMVDIIYAPETGQAASYRKLLKENLLEQITAIKVWSYEVDERVSKNGNKYIAGFHVRAGTALLLWNEYIYAYWSKRQADWFNTNRPGCW
jgi:hypothetical protein